MQIFQLLSSKNRACIKCTCKETHALGFYTCTKTYYINLTLFLKFGSASFISSLTVDDSHLHFGLLIHVLDDLLSFIIAMTAAVVAGGMTSNDFCVINRKDIFLLSMKNLYAS